MPGVQAYLPPQSAAAFNPYSSRIARFSACLKSQPLTISLQTETGAGKENGAEEALLRAGG
jgi:hypothetical protein